VGSGSVNIPRDGGGIPLLLEILGNADKCVNGG